jgi:hypothetical protein
MVTYLIIFVTLSISAAYGLSNDREESPPLNSDDQ